jgi:hypothetical protein
MREATLLASPMGVLKRGSARASTDLAKQNEVIVSMVKQRGPEEDVGGLSCGIIALEHLAIIHARPCSAPTVAVKPDL